MTPVDALTLSVGDQEVLVSSTHRDSHLARFLDSHVETTGFIAGHSRMRLTTSTYAPVWISVWAVLMFDFH